MLEAKCHRLNFKKGEAFPPLPAISASQKCSFLELSERWLSCLMMAYKLGIFFPFFPGKNVGIFCQDWCGH
jgi:hypothetical protein